MESHDRATFKACSLDACVLVLPDQEQRKQEENSRESAADMGSKIQRNWLQKSSPGRIATRTPEIFWGEDSFNIPMLSAVESQNLTFFAICLLFCASAKLVSIYAATNVG